MNKPYIDSISTKSDSKYLLIVAAAKRARQITTNDPESTRSGRVNPVSQALHEIDEDELTWEVGESSDLPADFDLEDELAAELDELTSSEAADNEAENAAEIETENETENDATDLVEDSLAEEE